MKLKTLTLSITLAVFTLFGSISTAYANDKQEDVEFIDLDGKSTFLSDYKGTWVIINLWATWCPPCLVEIPDLILFHEEHKDKDAIVIGVNYESVDLEKVKAFSDW